MKALFMFSQFTSLSSSLSCILSCYSWLIDCRWLTDCYSWNIILSKSLWTFKLKELWHSQMFKYVWSAASSKMGDLTTLMMLKGKKSTSNDFFPRKWYLFSEPDARPSTQQSVRSVITESCGFPWPETSDWDPGWVFIKNVSSTSQALRTPGRVWPIFEARKDISNLLRYSPKI